MRKTLLLTITLITLIMTACATTEDVKPTPVPATPTPPTPVLTVCDSINIYFQYKKKLVYFLQKAIDDSSSQILRSQPFPYYKTWISIEYSYSRDGVTHYDTIHYDTKYCRGVLADNLKNIDRLNQQLPDGEPCAIH